MQKFKDKCKRLHLQEKHAYSGNKFSKLFLQTTRTSLIQMYLSTFI